MAKVDMASQKFETIEFFQPAVAMMTSIHGESLDDMATAMHAVHNKWEVNMEVVVDSGASRHMFPNDAFFCGTYPETQIAIQIAAKGQTLAALNLERALFRIGTKNCKVESALHLPLLATNLLSLGTLQAQGGISEPKAPTQ